MNDDLDFIGTYNVLNCSSKMFDVICNKKHKVINIRFQKCTCNGQARFCGFQCLFPLKHNGEIE